MGLSDLVELFKGWGPIGLVVAVAIAAIVALFMRLDGANKAALKRAEDALKESNARGDRLEQEVAALNREIQNYLIILPRVNTVIDRANSFVNESISVLREGKQ